MQVRDSIGSGRTPDRPRAGGFTLIEFLAVFAVITVLTGLAAGQLLRMRERALVARVCSDLRQVEVALEQYALDHRRYPPVRVSCNTDQREHWCELPRELAEGGYLPPGRQAGLSTWMEDPFNPGHTYKYVSPGPYLMNGDPMPEGFAVYIPDDFPVCRSPSGRYYSNADAPLAWAVWSLGPRQSREKALHSRAPVAAFTWYTKTGDNGVIARIAPREGGSFQTP